MTPQQMLKIDDIKVPITSDGSAVRVLSVTCSSAFNTSPFNFLMTAKGHGKESMNTLNYQEMTVDENGKVQSKTHNVFAKIMRSSCNVNQTTVGRCDKHMNCNEKLLMDRIVQTDEMKAVIKDCAEYLKKYKKFEGGIPPTPIAYAKTIVQLARNIDMEKVQSNTQQLIATGNKPVFVMTSHDHNLYTMVNMLYDNDRQFMSRSWEKKNKEPVQTREWEVLNKAMSFISKVQGMNTKCSEMVFDLKPIVAASMNPSKYVGSSDQWSIGAVLTFTYV